MTEFAKDCLALHNELRAKHGAPPLELSDKLTEHAQKWAEHMAGIDKLEHSKGSGYGENIGMKWNTWGGVTPARKFVQDLWYNEVDGYDFAKPGTGCHFTQVVWKSSKELGVGMVKVAKDDGKTKTWVVCNYNPSGNWQGEFASNVQPEQ